MLSCNTLKECPVRYQSNLAYESFCETYQSKIPYMSMWKSEYTNSWLHNLGPNITHTHKYLITRCKPWNRGATLNKFILLKTMSFLEFLCYYLAFMHILIASLMIAKIFLWSEPLQQDLHLDNASAMKDKQKFRIKSLKTF